MENKFEEGTENTENKPNQNEDSTVNENKSSADHWNTIDKDPTKIKIESNIGELATGTFAFIKSTLSLRHGKYKYKEVVAAAREGVVFQGYNVWILICSIVVASIGLDMNAIAVVIGAMLISPLMGPIRGIGFGVGMNDLPLLLTSFKNFGVMVAISLVTSIVYFWVSPVDIANSELLGRTEPTFLDPMIAFFGGLAGIIAATNGKNDTVISGVAIATALMPPLCTAGWGIANGEWTYFLGASYLFLLNSLFIALSTVILLRYLHFPKREYLSVKIERKVKGYIIVFMIVIIAPSGWLFYKMTKRSFFEANSALFVEKIVKPTDENLIFTYTPIFNMDQPVLELAFPSSFIDSTTIGIWNRQKADYDLDKVKLRIIQGEDFNAIADRKILEALGLAGNQNELINMLKQKEQLIANLQSNFEAYKKSNAQQKDPLDLAYILKGFKEEFNEIEELSINRSFSYNKKAKLDTTYIVVVDFKPNISLEEQKKVKSRVSKRFSFELREKVNASIDSVSVVSF